MSSSGSSPGSSSSFISPSSSASSLSSQSSKGPSGYISFAEHFNLRAPSDKAQPTPQLSLTSVEFTMTKDMLLMDATISELVSQEDGKSVKITTTQTPAWEEEMDDAVRELEEMLEGMRAF